MPQFQSLVGELRSCKSHGVAMFFVVFFTPEISPTIFSKYKVPYPGFSVLNSFQGALFQAASVVLNDLILGELDGGQCSLFYTK